MKAVESSLTYRGVGAAFRVAGRCAACSLSGRAVARAVRVLRPWMAASLFFGTGRIGSTSCAAPSAPLAFSAIARPALALQGVIASGASGRAFRGLGVAATGSGLAGGQWSRVVGTATFGLGFGLLFTRPALGAVLMLVGVLLGAGGPWMLSVSGASVLAGRPAGRRTIGRVRGTTWLAMVVAGAAGVLTGVGSDTKEVVVVAVAVAGVGALLWRPQLILLVVAAFPWVDWFARSSLGSLGPLWDDALLLVSVALVFWAVVVLGRDVPRGVPITLPVLLMFGAAVGSIVINRVPGDVGFYALRVLFQPILFYFVGFLLPKDRRWVRWTVGVFILTCTALALHGVYQYLVHAPMPRQWVDITETSITTRAYSVVQNPNVLGGILAMGGLITGSLALSRATAGIRRVVLGVAAAIQLAGLAVTFSRGAWIGFAVGLIAMIVLAYRRYFPGVLLVGVVAWFASPRVFTERLLFGLSSTYAARSSAGLGRLWRWEAAWEHIAARPLLGLGLGTFGGTSAYMFGYWAIWVDNFYLQLAAEGGLVLLVFFLWLLVRGAKGLVRAHVVASDPYLAAVAAGTFGAFLAIMVADFFEANWETLAVGAEFWFLAGLVTSAVLAQRDGRGVSP